MMNPWEIILSILGWIVLVVLVLVIVLVAYSAIVAISRSLSRRNTITRVKPRRKRRE